MSITSNIPQGPLAEKWTKHKNDINLVNPANKRNIDIIVVGTGLAGGSAAASLAELGYNVKTFCYQDSPRRAHSIAAQGGINAAKNYQGDGDSTYRLFYDTIKGGDTALARPMSIVCPKSPEILLTNALLKGCLLPVNMEGFWTTDHLEGSWFQGLFMPKGKPVNSSCLELMLP